MSDDQAQAVSTGAGSEDLLSAGPASEVTDVAAGPEPAETGTVAPAAIPTPRPPVPPGRQLDLKVVQGAAPSRPQPDPSKAGLARVLPGEQLLGYALLIFLATAPVTMIFAMYFGYPAICFALLGTVVCILVTVIRRNAGSGTKRNRGGGDTSDEERRE